MEKDTPTINGLDLLTQSLHINPKYDIFGLEFQMNEYAIRTEHLSCHFGAIRAVDDLSLEIPI